MPQRVFPKHRVSRCAFSARCGAARFTCASSTRPSLRHYSRRCSHVTWRLSARCSFAALLSTAAREPHGQHPEPPAAATREASYLPSGLARFGLMRRGRHAQNGIGYGLCQEYLFLVPDMDLLPDGPAVKSQDRLQQG